MDDKDLRLKETKEAAFAFLDDYEHMASIVSQVAPKKSNLRRASGIVRRLLIDGDLKRISAPRIGRIELEAPDNRAFYVSSRQTPFLIFTSAGASIFGVFLRAGVLELVSQPRSIPDLPDLAARIPFTIDSFRKQNVICYRGDWMNRNDVIKYVANVGSGVHSGNPKSDADNLLARMRHVFSVSLVDPTNDPNRSASMPANVGLIPSFNANIGAIDQTDLPIEYDQNSIDCVLIELLSILSFIVESPDTKRLCEAIKDEI